MGTRFRSALRTALAGTLLLGVALTAAVIIGASPASATTVVQTIGVGNIPDAVSSDGTHVWVANDADSTVTELDASTGAVVQTIGVGSGPDAVSSDGTHVWVANYPDNTVTELDASTGAVVQTIGVGYHPDAVSSDGTHVWVANYGGNTVTELDASTGAVVQTIGVGTNPNRRLLGRHPRLGGELRRLHGDRARRLDRGGRPDHRRGLPIPTPSPRTGPTSGWRTTATAPVTELDASTGAVVQTIGVGTAPYGVSSDGTHVWVANYDDNSVTELDASTGAVVQTIDVGNHPDAVSSDGTHVWVANLGDNTVSELAPFQITTTSLGSGTASTPYSATVSTTGGTGPYTWSTTAGSLPPGLTLDPSTGTISGTPTTAGTFTFTVQVTDSESPAETATQALSITIAPSGRLKITTPSLPSGTVGVHYSATLTASGGKAPYLFWYMDNLPRGLHMDATTGVLSGRPSKAGTYNVHLRVRDTEIGASTPWHARTTLSLTIGGA